MASTVMEAFGMAAPEALGTTAGIAGPAGAVLGSGVMGAEAGMWLNKNTSAGETAQDVFSLMDKGLTGAAQELGIMGKGENKSAYLSATNWAEEHPVVTTLTSPLWKPMATRLAIVGGAAAAGAGLGTGVLDWLTGNTRPRY